MTLYFSVTLINLLFIFTENLSNEERTWEEIMQIKAMPIPMYQKKEMKAKLQVIKNIFSTLLHFILLLCSKESQSEYRISEDIL